MIVLDKVTKRYPARGGSRTIIEEVSLIFEAGVNVGILGRNGAGKSTLIRLLAKAEAPTRGNVYHLSTVSWPIGFSGGLQSTMTGRDNIRFVASIYGVPFRETLEKVEEFAELGMYLEMPFNTYSSGMRGRLAFGLSLAVEFDFYLTDELHSTAGDARFRQRSNEAFDRLKDKATFIVVSHQTNQIKKLCKIFYVLDNGQLTRYDDADEAIAVYQAL